MRERVGLVILLRTLIEVVRTVVELIQRRGERPDVAGGVRDRDARTVLGATAGDESCRIRRRRTEAQQPRVFRIAGGRERAGAVVVLVLQQRFGVLVLEEDRRVALAVGKVRTHQDVVVLDGALAPEVARHLELRRIGRGAPGQVAVGTVLRVLIGAAVVLDLNALERVVHDEVHDARDGVGTVHGRRTARQHFHPLDQRRRNVVEVGRVGGRTARRHALAVDEDEGAGRAEVAQVDGRCARCAVGNVAVLVGERLRQLVDDVGRRLQAGDRDVLRGDGVDRARALECRRRDARTGDFHLFECLDGRRCCCLLRVDHRRSQAEHDPGADRLPYGKRHFLAVHSLHHFPQEKVLQNQIRLFAFRQARPTLTQGRFPSQRKRFAYAITETILLQFRYRCRQISQTHDFYRY